MAQNGYLPNIQRLALKAMGVQSVVDLEKVQERAEEMGMGAMYIPGLVKAEVEPDPGPEPEPEPDPEPEA